MQIPSSLSTILDTIWQMLSKGALQKHNPLHTATIGSIANQIPQLRTVVLRKTDIVGSTLYFYTDFRSKKVEQLTDNNTLSWLFYHPEKNIQIRAIGKIIIHHQNDFALEQWQFLPTYGRKTYGTTKPPSTPLLYSTDDLPPVWKSPTITLADTEYAYTNFAVIACEIHHLEWLYLQRSGHQRAQFDYGNDAWKGRWIVP